MGDTFFYLLPEIFVGQYLTNLMGCGKLGMNGHHWRLGDDATKKRVGLV
jgi:hypothetical protein